MTAHGYHGLRVRRVGARLVQRHVCSCGHLSRTAFGFGLHRSLATGRA